MLSKSESLFSLIKQKWYNADEQNSRCLCNNLDLGNTYYLCATNYDLSLLHIVLVRVLQRNRANRVCMCVHKYVYLYLYMRGREGDYSDFKELTHMTMESQQVQNLMVETGKLETQERLGF